MSDSDVVVRLRSLVLHFNLADRRLTLSPRAAPPGTPEGAYRAVTVSFADFEQMLTARFMSATQPEESP